LQYFVFIVVLTAAFALLWSQHRSSRARTGGGSRRAGSLAAAPGRREPRTSLSPRPAAPAPAPGTAEVELDLARLQPVPEGGQPAMCSVASAGKTDLMAHAKEITERLQSRKSILDALSSTDYEPRTITELVLRDQALTARILRTVNSPFYGVRQPIGSVFRAVLLLGHVEVRNIIWRACVNDAREARGHGADETVEAIWAHSFTVSRVAYAMGKELHLRESDEIATAALLHDIGKLVYANVSPELMRDHYQPLGFSGRDSFGREEASFGVAHPVLGAEVARSWRLPETIASTIEHHHAPSYVDPEFLPKEQGFVAAVHLADVLCHLVAPAGGGEVRPVYQPSEGWLRLLGLRSLEELVQRRSIQIALRGACAREDETREGAGTPEPASEEAAQAP
jgi:putative nucleotidyltransferase with HDIG domain